MVLVRLSTKRKEQNNLIKARQEKYQSRIRVLETLATGTKEETQVILVEAAIISYGFRIVMNQLQLLKTCIVFFCAGKQLKLLTDAAENYHTVLAENRRLYNEVQELKGNIRVYCRIRPFLPGENVKQTTIEYIGDNGELLIANPSKQGKDVQRMFKFNKVFGPAASQGYHTNIC
ncbi:hypothetical protein GW17_00008864 [Ensete ventricosum]|nr:hypothetical protein GW17_00008864 [Ensete ventricosum]